MMYEPLDIAPALSVVVFGEPGPPEAETNAYIAAFVQRHSAWTPGGALGHVVLTRSDFAEVWQELERGDLLGSAFSILHCLGADGQQFIGRIGEFLYGWVGQDHTPYGRALLLQVVPQPDTLIALAAASN